MEKCKCCENRKKDETIIEALQKEMKENGYISKDSIKEISKRLNKPESEIYGVATFYSQFSLEKKAKYNITVCTGTTCFVLGAENIVNEICRLLNIEPHKLGNEKWYLSTARCLGCCGLAPVMTINGEVYGNLKVGMIKEILDKYN